MTKRNGLFLVGTATALALLVLLLTFSGSPDVGSVPQEKSEDLPAPQYTAEEILKHFEQQRQAASQDTGTSPSADELTSDAPDAGVLAEEPLPTATEIVVGEIAITPAPSIGLGAPAPPEGSAIGGIGLSNGNYGGTTVLQDGGMVTLGTVPSTTVQPSQPAPTPVRPAPTAVPTAGSPPNAPSQDDPASEVPPTQVQPISPLPAQETPASRDEPEVAGLAKPTVDKRAVPKLNSRGVKVTGGSRPQFPWPPPQASTVVRLPLSRFKDSMREGIHGEIADLLETALDQGEYFDRSYWVAPGGFALATRLERITQDGIAVDVDERWPTASLKERFDLSKYLRALFYTDPGYFRVIVFVLSTEFERTSDEEPTPKEAFRWLRRGMVMLPRDMAEQDVTSRHELTALIYEFEREAGSNAVVLAPGRLSGRTHLARARLQRLLGSE